METVLFKNIKQSILIDLKNAQNEIKIAVAWFTNHEFYNLLLKKLNDGIQVKLLIINDPINNRVGGLDWQNFINSGGELHFSFHPKIMHHKFCIIDNIIVYNGSYNWTYYADKFNRENSIRHFQNTELVEAFCEEFENLTLKNKKYKRVKQHSIEDFLKFQVQKAFHFYFAKEIDENRKWLTKSKQFDLAKKVLLALDNYEYVNKESKNNFSENQSIKLNNSIKKEILTAKINKELARIKTNRFELRASPKRMLNLRVEQKFITKEEYNKDLLLELSKQEQLLKKLKTEDLQGDYGELRINLKWSTIDDLDLHVVDPSNKHIFYSAKEATSQNSLGRLDVDANGGSEKKNDPQENIYWKLNPPSGIYRIFVVHYNVNQDEEVPFLVSIFAEGKSPKIIYSKVHSINLKSILVAEINYERGLGITKFLKKLKPLEVSK